MFLKYLHCNQRVYFLTFVFIFVSLLSGKGARITGKVFDIETNTPLFRANVFFEETKLGDMTNQMGYFTIKDVPPGEYTLQISMMGYKEERLSLSILSDTVFYREIGLKMVPIKAEGVVITGRKPMIEVETPVSLTHISLMEAKKNTSNLSI